MGNPITYLSNKLSGFSKALNPLGVGRDYEAIKVNNSITTLGLGINIANIFNSIPPTPKLTPKFIGIELPNEWNEPTAESIPSSSMVTTEEYDRLLGIDSDIFITPRSLI